MKQLLFSLIIILSFVGQAEAQKKFDVDNFKKERTAFLAKEIGLTEQEKKVFIPLCDELMSKKFELNRESRRKSREVRQKGTKASAGDYQAVNDMSIEIKVKEAALEEEYYQKFKTILSPEKIYKYYKAERQFMRRTVDDSK